MQQGDWLVAESTGRRPINKRQASSEEAGGVGVVDGTSKGKRRDPFVHARLPSLAPGAGYDASWLSVFARSGSLLVMEAGPC